MDWLHFRPITAVTVVEYSKRNHYKFLHGFFQQQFLLFYLNHNILHIGTQFIKGFEIKLFQKTEDIYIKALMAYKHVPNVCKKLLLR